MKYLAFIMFLIISFHFVYPQPDPEDKQMYIGIKNVEPEDEFDHTVEAVGTYWEYDTGWIVSSDPLGETSTITTEGNSDFNYLTGWPGWNFFWQGTQAPNEDWALGFYKVSNDDNSEYFYIDCRVDAFGFPGSGGGYPNPDFWVYLDASGPDYYYDDENAATIWNLVANTGDVVRIWDVHDVDPPSTNSLPDFWENVLVSIDDENDNPRIAWGPYPDFIMGTIIGYRIYRCAHHRVGQPGTFSLFATVERDVFEYTDKTSTIGTDVYANSYYIKCIYTNYIEEIFETSATNTVEIRLSLPQKRSAQSNSRDVTFNYVLEQNYPNPFNPATMIHFSIKNKSFATLKIYDILGNEVAVLLNDFVEEGDHSIEFNAIELPSGIYMYQLRTSEKSLTKKMILLR